MADAPTPPALPPLPYTVETLLYGNHPMPTKKLAAGGYGQVLTPDEIAVWAHLTALTAERDALKAEIARRDAGEGPGPLDENGSVGDHAPKPAPAAKRRGGR